MGYLDDIILASKDSGLPFLEMEGCNILVTGATGLIGSCLVKILMNIPDMNFDVYASGRDERRAHILFGNYFGNSHFHFIKLDVSEYIDSSIVFHYIIHAASSASPLEFLKHPVEIIKANIMGVSNLLEYGRNSGLKRFLYVSSGEVYGIGDGRVFDESYSGYLDCTSFRSCYPSAKRAAESLCIAYGQEYGLDCVIARPCHIYGPEFNERDNRAYAQFIMNARKKCDIFLKSPGEQLRSWCYVVDCATALLYILLLGKSGEAYNIADDNSIASVRQFAIKCADYSGTDVLLIDNHMQDELAARQSIYSVKKLYSLGWTPKTELSEGIINSINFKQYKN